MAKVKPTRIRVERQRRGWTQTQLAFFSSLSAADVSKIENGHLRPFPGQAQRLAAALEVSVEDLLTEVEVGLEGSQPPMPPAEREAEKGQAAEVRVDEATAVALASVARPEEDRR